MARSAADLQAIKDELTNDPLNLGAEQVNPYVALTAPNDAANATAMNEVRTALQIDREAIPTSEIVANVDLDEYLALSPGQREWLTFIGAGAGTVNPKTGSEVREGILQAFGVGTETRTALQAILTEDASRVEHMFKNTLLDVGGTVTPSDVATARQLP